MDIGCYPIKTSRMVFGEEPLSVCAAVTRDPQFGDMDMLTSAILEYPSGHCVFTCSTQIMPQQSMRFFGTTGRIGPRFLSTPRPAEHRTCSSTMAATSTAADSSRKRLPPCDQYTIQGDLFSRAIREGGEPPVPLEDSVRNMAVIDAVFKSAETGRKERPADLLRVARA